MSHDDIRAALEAATRQPWMLLYPGQCCEGFCIESEDGRDAVAHGLEGSVSDLNLITSAPTWLAELLAEVDRLTALTSPRKVEAMASLVKASTRLVQIERDDARARAEAAEAERDQLREEARNFARALGFGDGRTEPAATLAELVDPLTEAMSDSREHQECPVFCELCGERLAAVTCEACRGSGCLPNAEMAYLECGTCAGVGKVHNGCAEMTYAQLAASAEAAEQTIQRVRELAEHYDGRAYTNATGAILRALDGGEH